MAETRFLYEVLVRGTPDGQIAGAHQVWARAFTDDTTGEVIAVKHGNAEVLDSADVKALIAANFVGTANQIVTLQGEIEAANALVQEANILARQQADQRANMAFALATYQEEAARVAEELILARQQADQGANMAVALASAQGDVAKISEELRVAQATNRDLAGQIETLSAPPVAATPG